MTERFNGGLPQRRHHFTRQRALPFIAFALGAESGNTNHHRAAYHHELVAVAGGSSGNRPVVRRDDGRRIAGRRTPRPDLFQHAGRVTAGQPS